MSQLNVANRKHGRRRGESGQSIVEFTLMAPWILLLFIGILDAGFYGYALITVQNAARVAALHTSSNGGLAENDGVACDYALNEMRALPNIGTTVLTCGGSSPLAAAADVVAWDNADSPDGLEDSTLVTLTYTTIPLIAIPGLPGQLTITRTAIMRVEPTI